MLHSFIHVTNHERKLKRYTCFTVYIITAQSGVGKSKLARYMFIKLPYDYYKSTGKRIKLKIIYFALEESADEIIDYLICQRLSEQFKIRMYPETLSLADNLPADIIDKIRETREYFADLDLDIVDNIANPFGMYKYCREVSNQLGTITISSCFTLMI